ncbi:MAG: hypothetical protein ACTSWN_09405 [Promethearchaeota archaeon]
MTNNSNFMDLELLLSSMHDLLFPAGFKRVMKEDLLIQIKKLTRLLNDSLSNYHDLADRNVKLEQSPTLIYSQDLLGKMCRLVVFDEKDLTNFNQILLDVEKMLIERDVLIKNVYLPRANYNLQLLSDKKLHVMMERFLSSTFKDLGRNDD